MVEINWAIRSNFKQLTLLPDEEVDLARTALVIARLLHPDLDEGHCLLQLDLLAERLHARVAATTDTQRIADQMARLLHTEEGFTGNHKNYYDPDNSCLNRVLERRLGIPITLSLVYMEVGRRAGLTVHGIGLPGHFIIRLDGLDEPLLMDPFNGGTVLSEADCRRRIAAHYGDSLLFGAHLLQPVGAKAMLARILRNLKGVTRQLGDEMLNLQTIEWIIALDPNSAVEFRERGFHYQRIGAIDLAVRDLRAYLTLQPDAEDAEAILAWIEDAEGTPSLLH